MKTIVFSLLTLCFVLQSCNKDDDSSNDSLPPATQTGANTVGCLVNGEVFLPKNEGINPVVVVNYEFFNGEFFFGLTFKDQRGTIDEIVSLGTGYITLEENITYILDKNTTDDGDYVGGGGAYRPSNLDNGQYLTTSSVTGELTISRLDLSNSIISGTFWFDAINEQGEIVEIRDGRFDYVY
jgi:hypothetical protein